MKARNQSNLLPSWSRRTFARAASGLYITANLPLLSASTCTPDQIEAIIRLFELSLKVADRVAGALETRTRSSREAEKFVYECLYRSNADGEAEGSPIKEHPKYVVTTPADGKWHATSLRGFDMDDEGDFVVVTEGTDLYAVSEVVTVSP